MDMNKITSFKNRGMELEKMLEDTNQYLVKRDIAYVYKKPTPIKILKVEKNKIDGVFDTKSTTDYNGLYKGMYIDFEAKTTLGKTFSLSNIKHHQLTHLKNVYNNGGVAFLIVYFKDYKKVFYVPIELLLENKLKSLDIDYFINYTYEIKISINPVLNYLKIIDELGQNEQRNY